ncbi:MAG TPA: hypothetical protein VK324_04105 [Tepidisphaeraceae bacterium]|nr:hypothetical protein [Tepidisphaeraceae bacterium]
MATVADPVIPALEQQVACYARLAKLAELQHEFVQQGDAERLLDLLGRRQAELDQITSLERTIGPAKKQWAAYLQALPAATRATAAALLAETRRLLEAITTADRNDALVLQQRKLNLGRQITQASAAKQVNTKYATSAYGARPSGLNVSR